MQVDFIHIIRVTSLELMQSCHYTSASEATLTDMGK